MDIQALLALAAICNKNGRKELALAVLDQACNCDEFSTITNSLQPALNGQLIGYGENQAGIDPGNGSEGRMDGFDSYVDEVNKVAPRTQKVGGGVSPSENSFAPSIHGSDSVALGHIISIASAVYSQKRYLHDGDELIVDPQIQATAADLDPYDENELVHVNRTVNPPLKPGRVRIKM